MIISVRSFVTYDLKEVFLSQPEFFYTEIKLLIANYIKLPNKALTFTRGIKLTTIAFENS